MEIGYNFTNLSNGFVFRFYEALYDTLLFHLELVGEILGLQGSPLDLLFNYTAKVKFAIKTRV